MPKGLFFRLYRRNFGKLFFFSVCLAMGVAFLFAVGGILNAVDSAVAQRSRELMAADLKISSNRPFLPAEDALLNALTTEGARVAVVTSFSSMLRPEAADGVPFLVSVKAVDKQYPLYGRLETAPPASGLGDGDCYLEDGAAFMHGLAVGDRVQLGDARLTIKALITAEPDRSMTQFSLAPRVLIDSSVVAKTGLVRFGSRIRHARLIALAPSENPAAAARAASQRLEASLDSPYLRITAYADAEPTISRVLKRVTGFFVVVALITLMLGAIGMGSSLAFFLNEQLPTVGILRCLGLKSRSIALLYHGLCAVVAVQGALLGALLGWGLSAGALEILRGALGMTLSVAPTFDWTGLAETLCLSGIIAVGVPFARVRALAGVAPLTVLHGGAAILPARRGFVLLFGALALAGLYAYALTKSNSTQLARGFAGGLIAASAGLAILTSLSLSAVESLAQRFPGLPFTLRHGLLLVGRERARSRIFLFTLAAGFGLLGALDLVRNSLSREILLGKAESVPDLFLVDIQKSQFEEIQRLTRSFSGRDSSFSPLIRARLTHINDEEIRRGETEGLTVEENSRRRFLLREYNLSYSEQLNGSETIVAGKFWSPGETRPQISLEKGFSERMRVGLGDRLRFDIQGRPLEAEVSSIRTIDWMSMKPNFFVVLPTAVLEAAPQNFIGSFRLSSRERLGEFQRALGRRFSNVSVIDLSKVLDQVQEVLSILLAALKGVAWFCVGVGLLVLAGTIALDHRARARRAALFKALGCSRATLIGVDAASFAAIGLLTFSIGCLTALGLGRLIAHMLEIGFFVDARAVAGTLGAALLLPTVIGVAVNARSYGAGVMAALKNE